METLKLHSSGENEHIKSFKETFNSLLDKVKNNKVLSVTEKETELKKIKENYTRQLKNSKGNLY